MSNPFETREVLVCDDIRREDNGKAILIGVYTGDIVLNQFPAQLRLSFWLQGRGRSHSGPGAADYKIEMAGQDGEAALLHTDFEEPPPAKSEGIVVLLGVALVAQKPGTLVVSVKDDHGEWSVLLRKKVVAAA